MGKIAEKSGHGGGDFWCDYHFAQAIKTGVQPFLNVYRGVAMSAVGIMMNRSMQNGGTPYEIPDFRDKASREKAKKDTLRLGPDN
jgi:hypothetical protein